MSQIIIDVPLESLLALKTTSEAGGDLTEEELRRETRLA